MRATEIDIAKSIQTITFFLVKYIQEYRKCTQDDAIQFLTSTITYETLNDKNSKLFCESKEYVLDMLKSEIAGNIDRWMKL